MNMVPAKQLNMTTTIGRLSEQLFVADNDLIEQSVLSLIAFGLALPSTISPSDIRKVYGFALAGISQGAIKSATEKLMRGEYGPEYTDFIPTPPRFASFANLEQSRIVSDLGRERAKQNPQTDKRDTPVPTDEERARVREKRLAFKLQSAEFLRPSDKPVEDMSAERREYMRQLLSLPDRSAMTAEEMQHRNRIIANMEQAS